MILDEATKSQNRAAAPDTSTWLSANAGSGKTRVLTDRVARLLLSRVRPQNILCMTYTKAAASEMQNRLFQRLGAWAMRPDSELAEDLQKMGEHDVLDPERLAEARRLFARAIETPGGLRIQTIHSCCASLLRRFPLEAGVSPAFVEMDEHAAKHLRADVVEHLAETNPEALQAIAAFFSGLTLDDFTQAIVSQKAHFNHVPSYEDVLEWFDEARDFTMDRLLQETFLGTEKALSQAITALCATQSASYVKFAASLAALDLETPTTETLHALYPLLLYAGDGASKSRNFPQANHKKAVEAFAPVIDDLHAFMDRVALAKQRANTFSAAEKTHALYRFAHPFVEAYEARKAGQALLDFDDLIERTRILLSEADVADWVLFRLDGGLDHILVDEAQDTSPAQWKVVEALAQDFAAGRGAREDTHRTIFVVGDKKQSIYSFQGADPKGFDQMRDLFRDRLQGAGEAFQSKDLEFSFRSSQAVLDVVDTAIGTVADGPMTIEAAQRAFHQSLPGRVDLWPVVPEAETSEPDAWFDPVDRVAADHHDVVLAKRIAEEIKRTIGHETIPLPNGTRRLVRAGDFLILVRRRSTLFAEIIRACKALLLPVAGADRLKLGGELAVKDLAAVLAFLATPEDDLSLASALRSPLFGWSEADLYDLAAGRKGVLWSALRAAEETYPETLAILNDLRAQADFQRPYDLVERILSRHDGRRRLIARLGPEAVDGIDQFLSQALAYERREVPSLTGFLTWLETDDIEVKRQMDNAGDQIRVMTVHGAKGLEAPIVIVPDTAKRQNLVRDEIVALPNGHAVWKTAAGAQPSAMVAALDRKKDDQAAEDLRLLYVAMTRAETWLIVAAAGDVGKDAQSWHGTTRLALEALGADPLITPLGHGLRHSRLDWASGTLQDAPAQPTATMETPAWIDARAEPPLGVSTVSPSDLGGLKSLPGEDAFADRDAALQHGSNVHLLLEHLPALPRDTFTKAVASLLPHASESERATCLEAAFRILNDPSFVHIFEDTTLAEVGLTADVGGVPLVGTVDRLIVEDGRVLAVDFKTNHLIPETPVDVPDGVLRQMGAYDYALQQIYPEKRVETAILWTSAPILMPLPHEIVRQAWANYATS